jgi:MFS family permease
VAVPVGRDGVADDVHPVRTRVGIRPRPGNRRCARGRAGRLIGIGSLIGRFAIGALADRLGRTLTMLLMQASMGASYLLWYAAGGYPALVLFAIWFGLSYGGIVSLLPAICMDLFGARAVSSIIGTLYTGAAFGNLLGPVVAGAVFDRTGSYAWLMWGCIGLSAVATLATMKLVAGNLPQETQRTV